MPVIKKDDVANKVLSMVTKAVGDLPGMCIYAASFGYVVLKELGFDVDIFAGSLYWPVIRQDEDDGERASHLIYKWDAFSNTGFSLQSSGEMPDMHVWLGVRNTFELADFSTGRLKAVAKDIGLDWTADDPPRYFWGSSFPQGVMYVPEQTATNYAKSLIVKCLHSKVKQLQEDCSVQMPDLLFQISQAENPFLH